MEVLYLDEPDVEAEEAGWYVCDANGKPLAGPYPSKSAADKAMEDMSPPHSTPTFSR